MSKFTDPLPKVEHFCHRCGQKLQPLKNGIPHDCPKKGSS